MTRAPSFIEFCAGMGVKLTPAQRALCRVAFDRAEPGALGPEEREQAARLFGPIDAVPEAARAVLVAVCGARAGKSYVICALYSLWRALFADLSALAPGEVAVALIVAPDLRLGRVVLNYAKGAARSLRAVSRLIEIETSDALRMHRPDGARVVIEVLPATRGGSAVRGRSLVSAVLDECAHFKDESAVVNDVDVFRAVAPRALPGGLVVLASTPWIEAGLLHAEFSANFSTPTRALAAHAPTELMRPDLRTRAQVARERERDPDNALREFDAEFMTGGAGLFFPPHLLEPLVDPDLEVWAAAPPGVDGVVGGDLGLVRDASGFVAVHATRGEIVIAAALELRPARGQPLKLSEVIAEAAEFAEAHHTTEIFVDHHAIEPAREHLPRGMRLTAIDGGQAAKVARYERVRAVLAEGRVRVPARLRRIVSQLADVVARPTPGGGTQIVQPRRGGVHGDLASAAVIALFHATRGMTSAAERDFYRRLNATAGHGLEHPLGRPRLLPSRPVDDLGGDAPHPEETRFVYDMLHGSERRRARGGF